MALDTASWSVGADGAFATEIEYMRKMLLLLPEAPKPASKR